MERPIMKKPNVLFILADDLGYYDTSPHRRVTWTGGAVTMSAISAIDLAL